MLTIFNRNIRTAFLFYQLSGLECTNLIVITVRVIQPAFFVFCSCMCMCLCSCVLAFFLSAAKVQAVVSDASASL
jgi:hypothetical protein